MQFRNLFDDDRAVSPVIGVILMVAITVILAAVIGTFVLGLSDQVQETTPRASFGFDQEGFGDPSDDTNEKVTITHESGDAIPRADLTVKIDGVEVTGTSWSGSGEVGAGSTYEITDTEATLNNAGGQTVSVVWSSPDSDTSTTLSKHTL